MTPSATPFFKRAYKISHPPILLVSLDALPSFAAWSKIRPDFTIFSGLKIEVTKKIILPKNVRLTYYSSIKKIREIRMIFDKENSL